ncbi:MAG: hypothetical protein CL827_09910 [Crocinitomicaceae bacterium]|nr:hypothetical protein [Crocinitomicaceae bacterium]|tara:strand:- start:301 stop:762 length:462 start_codon:yes stop_codon:yes gene_type:complete
MNKINLRIEGDHEFGVFSMFLIEIERNSIRIPIFLTSEQTNLGLEDPEEPHEAIMELMNILLDSGFSIHQNIEIVNGDNSNEHHEFVENFNDRIDNGWVSEIQPINIKFSNPEDPENSNIELESLGGHFYTIYTESNDMSTIEMVEKLNVIFK